MELGPSDERFRSPKTRFDCEGTISHSNFNANGQIEYLDRRRMQHNTFGVGSGANPSKHAPLKKTENTTLKGIIVYTDKLYPRSQVYQTRRLTLIRRHKPYKVVMLR